MATDDDLLKALVRIENVLKGSSSTTGNKQSVGSRLMGALGGGSNNQNKAYKATTASFGSLSSDADALGKSFGGLSKTIISTRANLVAMNKTMRGYTRNSVQTPNTPNVPTTLSGNSNPSSSSYSGGSYQTGVLLGNIIKYGAPLAAGFAALRAPLHEIANDFLALQHAGINASSSLLGLYGDAIKAGMSLQDYIKVVEASNVVVSRSTSFDDFNKKLQSSTSQLNGLGIFGEDATKLAASMATSATTLGVSQSSLTDATNPMIGIFSKLRASVGLSGDAFQHLTEELSDNQEVQAQLAGLSQKERPARLEELVRLRTLGTSMGSTAKASADLANAIIEQRRLSVSDRFAN